MRGRDGGVSDHQRSVGSDLITPVPDYGFPGLRPGDRWCVVAERWAQAYEAGVAPPVVLASTNARALEVIDLGAAAAVCGRRAEGSQLAGLRLAASRTSRQRRAAHPSDHLSGPRPFATSSGRRRCPLPVGSGCLLPNTHFMPRNC